MTVKYTLDHAIVNLFLTRQPKNEILIYANTS